MEIAKVLNKKNRMPDLSFSESYLSELKDLLNIFPHEQLERIVECLLGAYENGRSIFVMGNGGSGATASHFACDINKGTCLALEKKFKVICLNDNIPTMLALSNDLSYEDIFVEQMKNFFQPGDIVMGISGSGNSENVLRAIKYALQNGGITIGFCGFDGGELGRLVDIPLVVESNDMQKIEDVHMIIVHMLMQAISTALNHTGNPLKEIR